MSVHNNTKFNLGEAYSQLMSGGIGDLSSLEDLEQTTRKEELEKLGQEIISAARGKRRISKKQFALMHGDSFIRGSNLEGGLPDQTLEYWKELLIAWREGFSFIKEVLTPDEIEEILLDIEDAITAYELIKEGRRNELLTLISDGLKTRGRFVVPIVYIGELGGHVFTAVFELDGDNMICQLLNRGEGIECHPAVEIIDGKTRRSYCSDQFIIPFKHFNEGTRAGQKFWDQLILYATTKPTKSTPDYCSKELYSYFYVLADEVVPIKEEPVFGATPQRAGSCAEKVPELLIRHYLHRHDPQEALKRRKRVLFATRFDSLLDAFHDLDLEQDTQNYYVLKNSLRAFGKLVSDLKEKHFITDQEVHLATALAKQVNHKLKEYEKMQNAGLEIPDLDQEFSVIFEEQVSPLIECEQTTFEPPESPNPLPEISGEFDAVELLENLQNWVAFVAEEREKNPERAFNFAYQAIQSLPIPTNNEDAWNEVPEEHIAESLVLLKTLTVTCLEYIQTKGARLPKVTHQNTLALYDILTTLSAFSIAHKLCSRLEKLKLQGYGVNCKAFKCFDSRYSFFYSLGEDTSRFLDIQNYFNNLKCERGKLFSIKTFDLDHILKFYEDRHRPNDNTFPCYDHHIHYLLQFTDIEQIDEMGFANLWENGMAEEYYILEHFAGLAKFKRKKPVEKHTVTLGKLRDRNKVFFRWFSDQRSSSFGYFYPSASSPTVEEESYVFRYGTINGENTFSLSTSKKHKIALWHNRSDYQEFLKIAYTKNSSIKISSLVNWMAGHVKRLDQKEIQHEILSLLLKPPHLKTAVQEEPYLAKQLRATLDEAIRYHLSKNYGYETALLLMRASYLVETQFLEIGNIEGCETRINELREKAQELVENDKTLKKVRYEVALTQLYFYRHEKELNDNDYATIISNWLETSFSKHDARKNKIKKLIWLEYEIKHLLSMHENLLVEKMQDPAFVNCCFVKINSRFNLPKDSIWEGSYPQFKYGNVSVDIAERKILVGNGGLVTNWAQIIGPEAKGLVSYLKRCNLLKDDIPLFYDQGLKEFWSQDRSVHIFAHKYKKTRRIRRRGGEILNIRNQWILEREFVINGERKWYQYIPSNTSQRRSSSKHQVWRACDNDSAEGLIHDGSHNEFFATFTINDDDTLTFYRLDQKGNETGETLANMKDSVAEGGELETFLNFLGLDHKSKYSSRIWLKEGKLSSVVLDKLNIEFKYNDEIKRLEAVFLPGYYLENQGLQSFLSLETALVLQNAKGEQKVLLPLWDFQLEDKKRVSYAIESSRSKARYCVFDLEEQQELLTSRDQYANLYLVILLAASGDYENAIRYLERLNPLQFYWRDSRNHKLVNKFITMNSSFNPLRSTFIIHLVLHFIENQNLRIASRYPDETEFKRSYGLHIGIIEHANFLLEANVLKQEGHLPHYLSLTIKDLQKFQRLYVKPTEEEPFTDLNLRKSCEKLNDLIDYYFQPTASNRNNWEKVVNHLPDKKYKIKIKQLPINPNVLHIRKKNLKKQFLTFYNDFVKEKDPKVAQMKFLPLLYSIKKCKKNDEHASLITALNIVMQNPRQFKVIHKQHSTIQTILRNVRTLNNPSLFGDKIGDYTGPLLTGERHPEQDPLETEHFTGTEVTQVTLFPLEKIASGEKDDEASGFFIQRVAKYQEDIPFALEDETLKPTTRLELGIFDDLMTGHAKNKDRDVYFYDLKEEQTLEDLSKALEDQIDADSKDASHLKKVIEKAANKNIGKKENVTAQELALADKHRLKKYWQQRGKMDFARHILPAFIMQDAALLKKHNPFLTDDEIEAIFNAITDYMLIISRVDQAKEAKQKIENRETIQAIGAVIHKKRLYDPLEYPEFLVYEYASGFLLRESQVELLKWILEEEDSATRKELLVEFQAGGGKTKIIAAILIFLAFKDGKLPVFYSLPSLHDITKDDLRSALSSIFNLKLAVLEFRLTTKLSTEELQGILEDLYRWEREGYALQVTPEVYHALYLNYQFALRSKDEERVEVTGAIRKFFHENGYFIIDEAHRNTTALWQANMTTGDAIHLSKEEQDLFVMCYKALTGNAPETLQDEDGRAVHELLEISSNQQGKLLPDDLPKVLRALAIWICEYYEVEPTDELIAYLTTKTQSIPETIFTLKESDDEEIVDLLFLARGLLTEIFPITLSLVGSFDHGGSIREGDEIESPRYGKAPSSSQYESAEIAAALCNQGIYQRGVNANQMAKLFDKIVNRYNCGDESVLFLFEKWTHGKKIPFKLDELDVEDRSQMTLLAKELGKHPEVIERYLRYHLLPQIKTYVVKLTSTAPALVDGGLNSILLSATIGRKEEYPTTDDQRGDLPFQAAVVQRALSRKENSELHWVDTASPKELYACLYEEDDTIFEKLEGLIDVGGVNIRYTTEEMAEQFLDFAQEEGLDYFGALYIQEETGSSSDKQQLTLIRHDTRERIILHGSNLYQALRKAGFKKPEQLKLFKVYGPTQYTGTDLKLTPRAKMLVLFSESTSLWALIQALMRKRGFIDPLDPVKPDQPTQSCVLVGPQKLKQKMSPDETGEVTSKSVFMYALSKEGSSTENRIIARAFQQIAYEHRRFIDQKMLQARTAQEQIALYEKHIKAFEEVYERNLQALFGNPETDRDIKTVLENFSNEFRKGAQISEEEWEENERGIKFIAQVIRETKALVPQVRQKKDLMNTSTNEHIGEQRTEEVGEEENQNKALRLSENQNCSNLESCPIRDYAENEYSVTSPALTISPSLTTSSASANKTFKTQLFSKLTTFAASVDKTLKALSSSKSTSLKSVNETFDTQLFSNELYILPDAYRTVSQEQEFLKNFEYLLVVFENGKRYVYLASRNDAEIYQQQLINEKNEDCEFDRKVALFTSQGFLAQNGRGRLAIPKEKVEEIRESLWLRRICTDVALLNGKIYDFAFFERQMSEWIVEEGDEEIFSDLYNHLLNVQGTPEEAHMNAVEYYLGQAVVGRTKLFTEEELSLIEFPEFGITEAEEMSEEEEEEMHFQPPPVTQTSTEPSQIDVTESSSSSEEVSVIVEDPSSSESSEEETESSSSSASIESVSEEDLGIEVGSTKRNIKVLPIVGGLMIITALVLALITGGWGAAAYFAPIHIANVWIYVSLGSGGGLSLLLFTGGSALTFYGCLKHKKQDTVTQT